MVAWQGYPPGSAAAIAAAVSYDPGIVQAEPGYPDPYSISGLVTYPGQETEEPPTPTPVIVPTPTPVVTPTPTPSPVSFNGVATTLPGVETDIPVVTPGNGGVTYNGEGAIATPAAFPLAPVVVAGAALSFGFLKRFFFRYGAKALKVLIGLAAFKEFMDLLGLGAPDEYMIKIRKNGKRRYSIGTNPRVGTLQKVSRHCQRLLKRHEKVIREFLPKRQPRYGIPPSKALSAIEKAAIRGN